MDFVSLLGSEDVARAGYAMRDAADSINRAASNFQATLEQHQRFMEDWLQRLEQILREVKS
jgi:hypothetical protein